jgi:DNA-binding protein YbaB
MTTEEEAAAAKARAENFLGATENQFAEAVALRKDLMQIIGKGQSPDKLVQARCGADGVLVTLRFDRERAPKVDLAHLEKAVVQAAKAATHNARKQAVEAMADFRKKLGELPTPGEILAEVLPDANIEYDKLPVSPMRRVTKAMMHEPEYEEDNDPSYLRPNGWGVKKK